MLDGNKVTEQDCIDAVAYVGFNVLVDRKTTVCTLTLYNGFTVRGESSCVDPAEFDAGKGREYAEINARENLRPVLAAILAEKLYRASQPAEDPVPRTDIELAAQTYLDARATYALTKKQEHTDFKAQNEAAAVLLKLLNKKPMTFGGYVLKQSNVSWAVDVEELATGKKLEG